ncbi:MAG: lactate utilization protein C [Burkholderiales bacterium]
MAARENILSRIRANQKKPGVTSQADLAQAANFIASSPQGPRPRSDWPDLIAHFKEQAVQMASTVDEVAFRAEIPAAVSRYLLQLDLPLNGIGWPEFSDLDWKSAGVAMEYRSAIGADKLGVTGCYCAIAETGTLLLTSSRSTPNATSLIPDTHIAIVKTSRIVVGMEEAWNLMRAELKQPPRACSFISGPSRTADIEQTLVIGAHGPYRVHIIVLDEPHDDLINTDWWKNKKTSA